MVDTLTSVDMVIPMVTQEGDIAEFPCPVRARYRTRAPRRIIRPPLHLPHPVIHRRMRLFTLIGIAACT